MAIDVTLAAAAFTLALHALVATFASAAPLPLALGQGARLQPFAAYGATRRAVVAATAPATFTANVSIRPGSRLISAVAVPDRIWTTSVADTAAPVRFRVTFQPAGVTAAAVTLYERTIDIAAQPGGRRWFDFGRDLSAFAGRDGTLRFEVAPARPDAPVGTLALWAPPEMLVCDDAAPSLVLVTVDALRGDRLGAAGYARRTTPFLDIFAAEATRFSAAFAAGPKTIPSVPQLLTGTYFVARPPSGRLAPLVGPAGFEISRAIVNNPHVSAWLDREDPTFTTVVTGELDARAITAEALKWLSAIGRCRSGLYLHYLDTHTPYHVPARYARTFIDAQTPASIGLTFGDVTGAWQGRYHGVDRRRIADLYDGAIAWTDRQLGRLFRGLARRGRLEHTVVIVTADHGEEFWEHGHFFHGQSLYDELLHVPLIVRVPGVGTGRVVDELVSTVDVLPTITAAAGLPVVTTDGSSLLPLVAGASPMPRASGADVVTQDDGVARADSLAHVAPRPRTVFATVSHAEPRSPPRHAVRSAAQKLIRNVEDGSIEVYDLVADPGERRNLGPAAPGAAQLSATLDGIRARLATRGLHLRVRSTATAPVAYRVMLTGKPPVPLVELDRLTLERGDRLAAGSQSSTVTLTGTVDPGDEDHVRLDALASLGELGVTITLNGKPAPRGTLRLGAAGRSAEETAGPARPLAVNLADPALEDTPRPAAVGGPSTQTPRGTDVDSPSRPSSRVADVGPPPTSARKAARADFPPVTIELWRFPEEAAPATAAPAPSLDDATRRRLRELGYSD